MSRSACRCIIAYPRRNPAFRLNSEMLERSRWNNTVRGQQDVAVGVARSETNVVEQAGAAVVAVNARRHLSSSGVYWRDGVIVTAAHTVRRTEDISVVLSSGETLAATVERADSSTDLAVLKITSLKLNVPSFGDPSQSD